MSPRRNSAFDCANNFWLAAACVVLTLTVPAFAQYSVAVTKKTTTPQLRAVAVLEWTGEAGKPKACRIVPITIFDGEKLNDAGIYLARPEPMAIAGEVEYQLKDNGRTIGLFDIKNTGQEQGSWVGYGEWKAVPPPAPAFAAKAPDIIDPDSDDKPVLHRKKHADDPPAANSGSAPGTPTSAAGSSGSASAKAPAAPEDPDRPKLHKKDESSSSNKPSSSSTDADEPTLHKGTDNAGSSDSANAPTDPDRPKLKKPKEKPAEDVSRSESMPHVTDPDRPRLQRGKSNADSLKVVPSLMGLPEDMQQAVAVSDAQNHPDHAWAYSWANAGDEGKMKAQLEDMARTALGLTATPPPPAPKTAPHRAGVTAKKAAQPAPQPSPAPALQDEQFRVFELSYGSSATLVLTADTGGPLAHEKFVTLVAQPDIYGNLLILLKNVTDGAHLDDTPHMRIVDAVDALADNRGELLFELRGETSRQFALYRILRGRADKMFVSGGGYYGNLSSQ